MLTTLFCSHCGSKESLLSPIPREASCESCHRDLRTCLHCQFFDENMNNQCRETQADRVVEKTKANFCGYFVPHGRETKNVTSKNKLTDHWQGLFKNAPKPSGDLSPLEPTNKQSDFDAFLEKNMKESQ